MVGTRTRIAHRVVCVSVWVSGSPGGHAGSPEEGQLSAPVASLTFEASGLEQSLV